MMKKEEIKIFFKDQKAEQSKIANITDLADVICDIRLTKATPTLESNGFEFPVVEIKNKIYTYDDALDILKQIQE